MHLALSDAMAGIVAEVQAKVIAVMTHEAYLPCVMLTIAVVWLGIAVELCRTRRRSVEMGPGRAWLTELYFPPKFVPSLETVTEEEFEYTLEQEWHKEQMLCVEKGVEQREAFLNSREHELQARLLEMEQSAEELQSG
ncbi:unnamed protein product, partial [Effrenium voratum]